MRTKSLAFLAGIIWLTAGFNVCRIGVVSWMSTDATTVVMILGCIATMVVFSRMFVRMLFQNVQRIRKIELEKRKLWDIMPPEILSHHDIHDYVWHIAAQMPGRASSLHRLFLRGLGLCAGAGRRDLHLCLLLSKGTVTS